MGPPISTWPYCQPKDAKCGDSVSGTNIHKKCFLVQLVDNFRPICLNFTFAILVVQVLFSLNYVTAGPVIFNMDYLQGPVPLARNIRHLPCISRRTGQEGLCMFAIDCLKANGSHLGTCIDRFYFGSCCQIPDKTILPQIIGNNIEDNTIDSGSFVHPQTEDKIQSTVTKIPDIFPTRKTTTEKVTEKTTVTERVQDRTESDDVTTLNDKVNDKLTTSVVDTTTKAPITKAPELSTELPLKLSTFQTVSGDISSIVTEESKTESTEAPKVTTSTTTTVKPTRRPTKPTYKPFRPTNYTRPQYLSTTPKPRPTKPALVFNITRKPPYRPPPKRPTTKKPLPSPPRLNITILPQSTSSRPIFTRPSAASITYINTTTAEDLTTTTTSSTTTTTTTPSTTTTTTTPSTTTVSTTEKIPEPTTSSSTTTTTTTSTTTTTTTTPSTTSTTTTTTEKIPETTEPITETTERLTTELSSESPKITTVQEVATEKETLRPVTEADITTSTSTTSSPLPTVVSTEYPPLVTWSTIDATKAPENATTISDETWSPITPPEGWVLISTIPPTPETSSSSTTEPTTTTTTSTTTTTTTTELPTTVMETVTTELDSLSTETTFVTDVPTSPESVTTSLTSSSSSAETPTTKSPTTTTEKTETTQALLEFTVNVTLSPTAATMTSTMTSLPNVTEMEQNSTEATTVVETTTLDAMDAEIFANGSSSVNYGKDDYKKVCGRRFWPVARIVGGSKSGFGQWPWQISLRQYRTSTYLHKCGAALLNENWAITAAHCVEHVPPSELLVRLGEHDLANEDEPYGYAERRVQIIASHPHFDPATFEYDLALLRFYEPVKFQPNIIPICIPDDDDYYVGKTAYVTGWGRLYDEGPLPSVLQEVQVPVINNSACEAMYQAAGYNEHIPNIFICAGRQKGGADSCEGDSGGPMVIQRSKDNRFVLSGVISWGIGCAEPNQPGVYTRISEFKDWINQILMF